MKDTTAIKKVLLTCILNVFWLVLTALPAEAHKREPEPIDKGYYKDLFMDGGIMLTSRNTLPAADLLGLSMEHLCTTEAGDTNAISTYERALQDKLIIGSSMDENGILLYPDGEPRFRLVYVNGGKATLHGCSLTPEGVERIQQFVAAGGSYVGTCAGAFFASKGILTPDGGKVNTAYSAVWDGFTHNTGLDHSYTALLVTKKSPLLKYYDFGGDRRIDSVYHNGGCYMPEGNSIPMGTEVLLRYDGDTLHLDESIHQHVNAWAYKESDNSGRVVVTGSHPEGETSGERLEMFASMLRYALDGNGKPAIKAELADSIAREMVLCTHDGDPSHTRIGDKQYHHFIINVPKKTKEVSIELKPFNKWSDIDLFLYASSRQLAFNTTATYYNVEKGMSKKLRIKKPQAGKLYVSVFCNTTVGATETKNGEQYTSHLEVLNGVPYTIIANLEKE